VYGRHAIAVPVPLVIKALIEDCDEGIHLIIPRWGVEYALAANPQDRRSFEKPAGVILDQLGLGGGEDEGEDGGLYRQAVEIVLRERKASTSFIQRKLQIGYNRAARLVESMEAAGLVGPIQSNGSREVLAPPPPES